MKNEINRILINTNQPGEIRVALLEGKKLSDLDIEYSGHEQKKSNIYKGKISRIEPSLEAVFIDYGAERHGFLPFKEIASSYYKLQGNETQSIKNSLKVGQEMMVQIEKEERGNKGAALTTYITLPGSYLVLMPNNPGAGGISRRIEGEERREMQDLLSQMPLPANMGLILRTAGVGRELEELQNDLNLLLQQWDAIQKAFHERSAPFLIFQEGDLITRSIRDYLRRDIDEIIIDDKKVHEKIKHYIEQIRPDFVSRISLYQNPTPLFMHFDIEEAVESAFQREIRLASGGTIVIDRTEALVAIDINSGRSTKNEDIEETAVKTNLEAAKEIAHQLRVRDLGGLIVIDFIDMNSEDNKRKVENCLREATKKDRARIQIGRLSSFGLLEMSRQRLRHSLGKANETLCPRCQGEGTIRTIESLALLLLRLIEKEALKKSIQQIRIEIPVDMATYLVNEKRNSINQIEQRYKVTLVIVPNPYWQSPQYKINTIGKQVDASDNSTASYQLADKPAELSSYITTTPTPAEIPAVKSLVFTSHKNKPKTQLGILSRLLCLLKDLGKPKTCEKPKPQKESSSPELSANSTPINRHHRRVERRTNVNRNKRHRGPKHETTGHGQQRHQNNRFTSNTKSITTPEKKTQPVKKRHAEKINQAINLTEKKILLEPVTKTTPATPATEKKQIANPVIVPTNTSSSPTTTNSHPARRNTRRYGGEPKLRYRSYHYEAKNHKTKN